MKAKKLKDARGKGKKNSVFIFCLISFIAVFLQGFQGSVSTYAVHSLVIDEAELFSQTEKEGLEKEAKEKGKAIGAELVILTLDDGISGNREQYAKNYLLDNDYGYGNGREAIIFMIDMYDRQYTVFEYNEDAENYLLTDYEGDCILDALESYMRSGNYYGAARRFLEECVYYAEVTLGGNYPQKQQRSVNAAACAAIGLVCGGIITSIMVLSRNHDQKPEMRTYMKGRQLQMKGHKDIFTHTTTVKRKIETESKGGSSGSKGFSGGNRGGGHGGSRGF